MKHWSLIRRGCVWQIVYSNRFIFKKSIKFYFNLNEVMHSAKLLPVLHDHDDVIKWKHFLRYWPFVWGIHRSSVNFPKASDAEL